MSRSFNGTTNLIIANGGTAWALNSAFSVSAWVKGAAQNHTTVYGEGITGNANACFNLASDATTQSKADVQIINQTGTNLLLIVSTATVFDSTWHHLAVTQTAARFVQLYVDGVADVSGTTTSGTTVSTTQAAIGALRRSTNTHFFSGSIGEVANWTRTLAAKEVASLANGLPASHLAPTHYWPLWGVDSPEPDIGVGTHVAGALTGTAFATGGRSSGNLLYV